MDLFEQALVFAIEKHSGQTRKFSSQPYILHPIEVASIAATMTDDPEVLAAAVLHDTVEDAGVSRQELYDRFGARVTELVFSETEEKPPEGLTDEESWIRRKAGSLKILGSSGDRSVKILWISDKLSNLRSFRRRFEQSGERVWEHCHQRDGAKQAWYYRSIAEAVSELRNTDAFREFLDHYHTLFQNVEEK